MENFELYVITTQFSINETVNFLKTKTKNIQDISSLRKVFYRDPKTKTYFKTDKQMILLKEKLYLRLRDSGFGDEKKEFYIKPYIISKDDASLDNVSTMNYYFPVDDENKNYDSMVERMNHYTKIKLLSKDEWFIHKSEKYGICEFSDSVNHLTRIKIKILLDNPAIFRVSWCRLCLFKQIKSAFKK
jgi:hypothetical protein